MMNKGPKITELTETTTLAMLIADKTPRPMILYTIYDKPEDYPRHFVVRSWNADKTGVEAGPCQLADTLEGARALVPVGMVNLGRVEGDDAKIVETWI
jgi:hypothetical protein